MMKLLKLFKYKEQAHVLMDLLHDKGIRFEERKLSPVEIFVSEDDFESAFEIMRSNERLIEASSEKWYAVTTAPDEITAQIIKSSLESENIPTLLKGIAIPYGEPIIFGQGGLVPMEILVPGSYVQTAKALLETSAAHPEEQNGEAREENRTHTIEEDTEKKEEE
ncbi:MAG TPA: DUF2007 domain-containing protein [Thermotogota bacterium]|jgi:hypothetical protein|nr:DUF2007 domain-containing protein [Thermotogota bacterium]HPG98551.1 DUF2007 domain-containing protein [Thermotogota bacterium]HPN27663.1 DUF2007 domain-containing protein [Thermotogota bacterium]HPV94275.1 DUF2007 domain-containing protein [Thermotogota bacterium]HPY47054.1 DUF2007 domain-containing protein [Thermotogota bacterium]